MSRSNRRKTQHDAIIVLSTATSGVVGESDAIANHDSVSFWIAIATATAGTITFKIQVSQDEAGSIWFDLATTEMTGSTGALAATGNYHIASAVPVGFRARLAYTIVTGPFAFVVYPTYEKTGKVF